jgi:hypothetical protein
MQYWQGIEGSLLKVASVNFFCLMKSSKKSVAGPAVFRTLLSGESKEANNGSSAKIVAFCLPAMHLRFATRTALCGFGSG